MKHSPVRIESRGKAGFRLKTEVTLPRARRDVFAFFADAANLERITPAFLNFRILTPLPVEMRTGARIDYKIRLHGIPIRWRTSISRWEPEACFVDEQIRGPYRQWRHEHRFRSLGDSTVMTDVVDYRVWLAALLHPLIVRKDLIRIFEYRCRRIHELFGEHPDAENGPRGGL